MIFANPQFFWLFLIFIPIIVWYILKHKKANPSLIVSTSLPFNNLPTTWKVYLRHAMFAVKLAAIGCLIIILCRPQTHDKWNSAETDGTDIVIAMDISGSMMTEDIKPNRFEAAKEVASQFINGREFDNMGIVIFAGESFTLVPLTTDKSVLINYIQDIKMGMLEDLTAIGDGIATSINRIKNGKAKSKSIILITDGTNNKGLVAPLTAAEIAHKYGIKVYTVGIGTDGTVSVPIGYDPYGRPVYENVSIAIDEKTLKDIANITGGKYFRATDKNTLKEIFNEIDQLEKTEMDVKQFSHKEDNYMPWALLLLVLVCCDFIVRHTILKNIP